MKTKTISRMVKGVLATSLATAVAFGVRQESLAASPQNQENVVKPQAGVITPQSIVSKTKSVTFKAGGTYQTLSITGTFETQYSDIYERQMFAGIKSITSKVTTGGSWKQTGYEVRLIDGGRTYVITVSGYFTIAGVTYTVTESVEFYCNADGSIS
ncbi:hypothetical protein P4S83_09015 [Aneurinibacillus thermoaerophilus]|uniref:hypothetical protein n=1 Tax=Aneurinibacillus TaxID=55079 RepID=UPI00070ACC41|nr:MULTISPECIES: hypothetical protein [Aneurinibacillus]AMA74256.1 hypothetical protein ACH33_16450 [Aneurinibacillus sp. XH2]MED0676744.1 hypothetical protein [Aneurinibacillus thermoaerophilus]MED0680956.1 hypothetical protein [Aneurinibacillus thermoaerophilus]MED0762957.1 hypothetical protein [Aneurinibacillus thermoaerophilus]